MLKNCGMYLVMSFQIVVYTLTVKQKSGDSFAITSAKEVSLLPWFVCWLVCMTSSSGLVEKLYMNCLEIFASIRRTRNNVLDFGVYLQYAGLSFVFLHYFFICFGHVYIFFSC